VRSEKEEKWNDGMGDNGIMECGKMDHLFQYSRIPLFQHEF
jgi:hypothetical protein